MEYISNTLIEKTKSALEAATDIVILTHMNPDGDALGSSLGLYHFLKLSGKNVTVISPNSYPDFLHWLPGDDEVVEFDKKSKKATRFISQADTIFLLDFNELKRIGKVGEVVLENKKATKILVDHHPNPVEKCQIEISDIRVSSTAELVFHLLSSIDKTKVSDLAVSECLFTGILTDTGCFSFNSSRPSTYEAVATLLKAGVNKDKIYDNLYNNFSADRMKLLGFSLDSKMKVIKEYKTAYVSLSREEMEKYNFSVGDSEGFVNFPLSIKGIIFSVLFLEKKGHVKLSLRSKGDFPANDVAKKYFNGGGHKNAAGGESKLSLSDTIERFESILPEYSQLLK